MSVIFETSPTGRLLSSTAGFNRPLKIATFGTSHMTTLQGFGWALQYALCKIRNADVVYYSRQVLTSTSDATVLANPGQQYATPSATSAHMVGAQLTQFNADVVAGKKADIMFTDGGVFNDAPGNQAALDTAFNRTLTLISTFLDPAGNGGMAVGIYGLFGLSPQLCSSWANMWRKYERISGGRVRFIDTASVLCDPTNTSGTAWAWRGGNNVFGAATGDGTHLSTRGSEMVAPLIADFLSNIVPRSFQWAGGMNTGTPSPATLPNMNMLGPGAAMIGTAGLLNYALNTGVPGTGASGANDKWSIATSGGVTVAPSITTGPNGERQLEMALSGTGGMIQLDYKSIMTSINNGVASRVYMMGIEIELAGVTGLNHAFLRSMSAATWDTPQGSNDSGGAAHGLPDNTSETWKLRTLYPVAWTGNDPQHTTFFQFRTATLGGTIKVRNPFLVLVDE